MYTLNVRSINVNKYLIVIFWIDAILELKVWGKILLELSRGILIIRKQFCCAALAIPSLPFNSSIYHLAQLPK